MFFLIKKDLFKIPASPINIYAALSPVTKRIYPDYTLCRINSLKFDRYVRTPEPAGKLMQAMT